MDLNSIRLDLDKISNGVWEDLDGETSILVARMYNTNFNKRFQELTSPYRNTQRKSSLTDEKANDIMNTCLAETILLGWKGLKSGGADIQYSVSKAKELLEDPKLQSFRRMVLEIAENEAKYREEEVQDTVGKLKPSSVGSSSGAPKKISSKAS